MIITEDILYELLKAVNKRLKEDFIKEPLNTGFVFNMMQIKRISIYNLEEKIQITVTKHTY